MNPRLALGLSTAVLSICLLALVSDLIIYLAHIPVAPRFKATLDVISFGWPLAMIFFGTYLRKVRAGGEVKAKP
jgi:hypothetical protein